MTVFFDTYGLKSLVVFQVTRLGWSIVWFSKKISLKPMLERIFSAICVLGFSIGSLMLNDSTEQNSIDLLDQLWIKAI